MAGRVCVYPGSFDPITVGHMDIIRRSVSLFDRVVVAVLHNPQKTGCFTLDERLEMLRDCCRDLPAVSVETFDGLTMDFARRVGACAVVRGIRTAADYPMEESLARINQRICPEVETVLLLSSAEHSVVSSSCVRELAMFGGDVRNLVPEPILERVRARLSRN